MVAARKFECFCLDPEERWLFAGDVSGQISVADIDGFQLKSYTQAHVGGIQAIVCHPHHRYIASLSTDRTVSVWAYDEAGTIRRIFVMSLRFLKPSNDHEDIPYVQSTSQAIGFHDSMLRLVTRSGNAGLVEVEFDDDGRYKALQCVRLHRDADLTFARYVRNTDMVLSGSIDGELVLSHRGEPIRHWRIGHNQGNIHWAEHICGTTYLLATDLRNVVRIDIERGAPVVHGEPFTLDDLEHVTFNRSTGRAFVASFDRTIYELCPETCKPIGVVFRPPFKCRWIKTLERDPRILLVQCRNGALYKVDLGTGQCISEIKFTPDALWTAVAASDGTITIAGEGSRLLLVSPRGVEAVSRLPSCYVRRLNVSQMSTGYTKRMVLNSRSQALLLGRSNGEVVSVTEGIGRLVQNVGSAIRDIALSADCRVLFVACEDGRIHKVELLTGRVSHTFQSQHQQPFWSLAYNAQQELLAVAERGGTLSLLTTQDLSPVLTGVKTARPKRMKWVDEDVLLYNKCDQLYKLELSTGKESLLVDSVGNTIEDFIWDVDMRYLVLISYTCNIYLCDFATGELISTTPDQMDYSKGLIWFPTSPGSGSYPLDFLTFGRSGTAHLFRIHDEKILALGPVEFSTESAKNDIPHLTN